MLMNMTAKKKKVQHEGHVTETEQHHLHGSITKRRSTAAPIEWKTEDFEWLMEAWPHTSPEAGVSAYHDK